MICGGGAKRFDIQLARTKKGGQGWTRDVAAQQNAAQQPDGKLEANRRKGASGQNVTGH